MAFPRENPWLFHRDEFNLLEEDFEAVLRSHEAVKEGTARYALEQEVIDEQARTEEASENELAERLGPEWAAATLLGAEISPSQPVDEAIPLRETLRRGSDRDPLYLRAREWAIRVSRRAHEAYEAVPDAGRDAYRAHLNAYLVPIKVCFALSELEQTDAQALDIAEKECELAETYLSRVQESLEGLGRTEGLASESVDFLAEGAGLGKELRRFRAEIIRKKPFDGRV